MDEVDDETNRVLAQINSTEVGMDHAGRIVAAGH